MSSMCSTPITAYGSATGRTRTTYGGYSFQYQAPYRLALVFLSVRVSRFCRFEWEADRPEECSPSVYPITAPVRAPGHVRSGENHNIANRPPHVVLTRRSGHAVRILSAQHSFRITP